MTEFSTHYAPGCPMENQTKSPAVVSTPLIGSLEHARHLAMRYKVPLTDVILMALNIEGVHCPFATHGRIRFRMIPISSEEEFFIALTNTNKSRWVIDNGQLFFADKLVASVGKVENDTCDTTYFRRFIPCRTGTLKKFPKMMLGTAMTINSNSRSSCFGCKFCGTYSLDSEDAEGQNLTTKPKLRTKLNSILRREGLIDLSHIVEIGLVTGCFDSENEAVDHLLMLNGVLRNEYDFRGELKYVGASIRSPRALRILAENTAPFGIALTIECFTRRDQLLRITKRLSLDQCREILTQAKSLGISTTILYIMGLDPLDVFQEQMNKYLPLLTEFPVINTMQEYVCGQAQLRHSTARSLEYYLHARQIVENIFRNREFQPLVWENYRGLFFTEYLGKPIHDPKI